jgi:hypothetical protein
MSGVMSEKETRRRILAKARSLGIEVDVRRILEKTDNLLRHCTNEKERKEIAMFGALEVHMLLSGNSESLEVNGKKLV